MCVFVKQQVVVLSVWREGYQWSMGVEVTATHRQATSPMHHNVLAIIFNIITIIIIIATIFLNNKLGDNLWPCDLYSHQVARFIIQFLTTLGMFFETTTFCWFLRYLLLSILLYCDHFCISEITLVIWRTLAISLKRDHHYYPLYRPHPPCAIETNCVLD